MSQTHLHIHMALSEVYFRSEGQIYDKNKMLVILNMVKQTIKKYQWEMESQPANIQGD